jgi:acetyltransferase EpsM
VQEIVIIGAGGHGSELASYIQDLAASGKVKLLGFIDDNKSPGAFCGTEVLGNFTALMELVAKRKQPVNYITAVGNNELRRRFAQQIQSFGTANLIPWTLTHPSALVGSDVMIGPGTCVAPNTVLTTRIRIGAHCILNVKASVSHDCVIGDFVNINPAATLCGNVTVGDGAFIGAGATVKEKISIGRNTIVGAGAVVVRDLPENVTAVGVPARIIKTSAPPQRV